MRARQRWLLAFGVMGMLSMVAAAGVVLWVVFEWRAMSATSPSDADNPGRTTPGTADPRAKPAASSPSNAPSHAQSPKSTTTGRRGTAATAMPIASARVPDDTTGAAVGDLEVVDIGLSAGALKKVLRQQLDIARAKHKTMLLMITGTDCKPCSGVADALADDRMQKALVGIRLVRVDLKVFRDELKALHLPVKVYPAFLLVDDDLRPRDGIHGGEWDDDIAANIAPVLAAFVRGTYTKRRHPDWAPSTGGVRL